MKILSAQQIREADAFTIAHEPIASVKLMERAALAFTGWFVRKFARSRPVKIFCGIGNNGGDGLAVARLLKQKKYKVEVFIARYAPSPSKDFLINEKRLKQAKVKINNLKAGDELPEISSDVIIIDGLWGSGLSRPIEGFWKELIVHLNNSAATRVAIDIPSGLYADGYSDSVIFKADFTFTFEFPKLSFFFPQNYPFAGDFSVGSIGIHPDYIRKAQTSNYFITADMIRAIIRPRKKFDHKGTYGHALIISGSYGKMGAAVLCTEACIRAGAGLTTAYIPTCGYQILQNAVPEAMVITDKNEETISNAPDLSSYRVVAIGPGLGKDAKTADAVLSVIKNSKSPMVMDADGLNILAENKEWLAMIPENSILTPHPKEFERLFGESKNDYDRHELQKKVARKHKLFIVLKQAHTAIATPDGETYFNSTGNPGMATGGSGDVLTGVIAGLLSQGYNPLESAMLGVYWHGLAGDIAAEIRSQPSMTARDITHCLGAAYKKILS